MYEPREKGLWVQPVALSLKGALDARAVILGLSKQRPALGVSMFPRRFIGVRKVGLRPVTQRLLMIFGLLAPLLRNEDVRIVLVPCGLAVKGGDAR